MDKNLIEMLAADTNLPQEEVRAVIQSFIANAQKKLAYGLEFPILGLGRFYVSNRRVTSCPNMFGRGITRKGKLYDVILFKVSRAFSRKTLSMMRDN